MTDWRGLSAYVTGATGLVGGWVAGALLARGANVVALIRDDVPGSYLRYMGYEQRCSTVRGSIEDLALQRRILADYAVDAVFHLAAQTQVGTASDAPYSALESNVRGTYTILDAVRSLPARIRSVVVASSDKAYGDQATLPYTESMPLLGSNVYDASKACADIIARAYARSYGLPVVVARCANIFGGGDLNWARLIPGTLRAVIRGERPVLRSDGQMIRDYLFVGDAVDGLIKLAERATELSGEAFNFSMERPLTVIQMVGKLAEVTGTQLDPEIRNEARGEIRDQHLSADKARTLLGWSARVPLENALRETFEWYRAYLADRR